MTTITRDQQSDAQRASRAIGAMFFAIFGGAWIVLWSILAFSNNMTFLLAIIACTLIVFTLALSQYQHYKGALETEKDSPQKRRVGRLFNLINAIQWVVILVGGNVLANIGLREWVIPFAIFVIGLHFIPLARIFANPPHYATAAALIMVALAYPWLLPGGPNSPIGCLGTGLILWASAMWAIRHKKHD